MNKLFEKIKKKAISAFEIYDAVSRGKAVDSLEYELGEMENIFGLLVLSAFVGLPAPPMQITLDLLPEMEKHLLLMLNKVNTAENPLSDLLSAFNVI